MYRLFSALVFVLLLNISITIAASPGQIRGQVRGRVKDESGQSVRGAAISLSARDGRQLSTISDEDGTFIFNNLRSGDYFVKTEAAGFRAAVSEEIHLGDGEKRELEINLRIN